MRLTDAKQGDRAVEGYPIQRMRQTLAGEPRVSDGVRARGRLRPRQRQYWRPRRARYARARVGDSDGHRVARVAGAAACAVSERPTANDVHSDFEAVAGRRWQSTIRDLAVSRPLALSHSSATSLRVVRRLVVELGGSIWLAPSRHAHIYTLVVVARGRPGRNASACSGQPTLDLRSQRRRRFVTRALAARPGARGLRSCCLAV